MSNKPKIAIVGVGRWGKNLLKELNLQGEVLWACYGDNEDSNKFLEENYPSIKKTSNLDDVLKDKSVEIVFVATPTETHLDIATEILNAGKHLFLEKPGTTKSQDLEILIKRSKEQNLKFAVGYEFPHHPVAKKLKDIIFDKKIKTIYFEWHKWGTFNHDAIPHLLSHDVSVMKYLDIKNISIKSHKRIGVFSDSDIIETDFESGNIYIKSFINRVSPTNIKAITIILENETYIWNDNELFEINKDETFKKIETGTETPVALEINDFLSAIKENREPLINADFALDVFKTIEQVKI